MSPGGKSESTDVGDCRLLSQAPFHDRPNRLTWSSVMMRNRKSTSAKQVLRMSGIYVATWRPLWNSHAYLVFQVHPCVSDLQGGYEGELLEIEMQGFLDYLQNRAQMFENILTSLYKFFSEYGVQIEIGAKSHFLLFTALPRNGLRKLLNIFPSSWKSSVGKFLIVLWCTLVHFLLPEETGNTFWQTLKSSKTCIRSSTSDDLLLLGHFLIWWSCWTEQISGVEFD